MPPCCGSSFEDHRVPEDSETVQEFQAQFYGPKLKKARDMVSRLSKQQKKNHQHFGKEWRKTSTGKNLDKVLSFFSKMKPCTFVVLLRSIVEGSGALKMAAVLSLFEQMGVLYNASALHSTYIWVVDFIGFIIDAYCQSRTIRSQLSVKERLEELFGFNFDQVPSWVCTVVSAAVGFITLITGGLVTFFCTKGATFVSFLRGFGEAAKTSTAVGSALAVFKKVFETLLKAAGFEIEEEEEFKEQVQDFSDFVDKLEERVDEVCKNPYKLADGTIDTQGLNAQAREWEQWFREVSKDGSLRAYSNLYTRCVTSRTKLMMTTKSIARNVSFKQVPVVVWLWGMPGVGKSTSISKVIDQLSILEGRRLTSYVRATDDAYWSGYEQQDIVIYDDFSVDPADATDARELMRAHTNANFPLNMAALDDKGTCFRSRYILIASNYDTSSGPLNFGAIHRRRDFMYVTWNTKVSQFIADGGDLETFNDFEGFEAAMCFQRYAYDKVQGQMPSQASGTMRVGDPLTGMAGIRTIAERAHAKMLLKREEFVASLKLKLAEVKKTAVDARVAPGINLEDLEDGEEPQGEEEFEDVSVEEATAAFPRHLDRARNQVRPRYRGHHRNILDQVLETDVEPELHAKSPEPLVYIFYGEAGTGKTTLAAQCLEVMRVPEEHVMNDCCDNDIQFATLTTHIREYGDKGKPLIITLNTDRFEAYHKWLVKEGKDFFERTMRRVTLFRFERFKGNMFSKKVTLETGKEGCFEANNIIHEMNFRNLTKTKQVTRLHIGDLFRFQLGTVFVGHYQADYVYCVDIPECIKVPLRGLSLAKGPSPTEVMANIPWTSFFKLAKYRGFAKKIASRLFNINFNEMTPEGFVRQINDLKIATEVEETLCLQFKEGDFYIINLEGIAFMALGNGRRLKIVDGNFYFVNPDGGDRTPLNDDEVRFHKLALGEHFDEISVDEMDVPYGEIPGICSMVDFASEIFSFFTVMLSTSVVALNLVEMFVPKPIKTEGRIVQNQEGDYEELNWADEYEEYRAKVPTKRRRIRLPNGKWDYDDVPVHEHPGYYCESAGPSRYPERHEQVSVETHEKVSVPTKPKVVVETHEKISRPNKPKVVVEYMDEAEIHNRQLTNKFFGPRRKGADIYYEVKGKEKYHFVDFEKNIWCPAFLSVRKAPGGTSLEHHTCRRCKQVVLKLWNHNNIVQRCCYQCRGYEMPDEYFHGGCDHCQDKIGKAVLSEGSIDPSFSAVQQKVCKNVVRFPGFHGLMLHGFLGCAPNHCIPNSSVVSLTGHKAIVKHRIPKKDLCFFLLEGNGHQIGAFPDIRHFLMNKGDKVPAGQKAMINVPRGTMMLMVPIFAKQFVRVKPLDLEDKIDVIETRLTSGSQFETYFTEPGDCGSVVLSMNSSSIQKILGVHVAGSATAGFVSNLVKEDIPTLTQSAKGRMPMEKVIDNQFEKAFYGNSIGAWCPFFDTQADAGVMYLCSHCRRHALELVEVKGAGRNICYECSGYLVPDYYFHNRRTCGHCSMTRLMKRDGSVEYSAKSTQQVIPADGLVGDTLEVYGVSIDSKGKTHTKVCPGKTRLRESPFRTDKFGVPFEPAIMTMQDPRNVNGEDPYLKNVDKWDRDRPQPDQNELNALMREMGLWFAQKIKSRNLPIGTLTVEQAINRDVRHPKSNPIYMHSSAGFPYNTFPRTKEKFPMMKFDEKLGRYRIDRDTYEGWVLTQNLEYILDNARKGQKTMCVFDVNLKDESLPKRKIDDVKTRSIVGSPLDFTILYRMYFHTIGAAIMEVRDLTPVKVGIAPNTMEWHELSTYLSTYSTHGFDGDYKHWDASCTAEEILSCAHFYNAIAQECDPDWKEEDDQVRMTMYQMLSKPLITRENLIVQAQGGVVSGQPHTSIDNSILNLCNLWRTWRDFVKIKRMKPVHATFRGYEDNVKKGVVGDDNLSLPKPEYPDYDFLFVQARLKEYGKEYTPSTKTDEGTHAMKPLSKMTFLKRHFLFLEETTPYCVGGLVDEAFNKMTSCCRVSSSKSYQDIRGKVMFDESICQTVETFLAEASLRGKSFYDFAVRHVKERCSEYGIPYELPYSWEHQFNAIFHDFNINYVNAFM